MGTDPEKLYKCIMVYNANEYWLSIEAINENGIGPKSKVLKVD